MGLNYIYHRQQLSLFMAANAASEAAWRIHRELADGYASRIAAAKNTLPSVGTA